MIGKFVHPYTKKVLEKDSDGNLFCLDGNRRNIYRCIDSCCDFSVENMDLSKARNVYDEHYKDIKSPEITLATVTAPWVDNGFPWRRTMLEKLGSLSGKRVLLLGNGASYKEFYFLHLGAHVVFTDLSLAAARRAKSIFYKSELWERYKEHIEFHAVDAMHMPFPDESFDVIYGTKFVGFLNNLPEFFCEVRRCLKPGGICRFADDAYSPAWDAIRRTIMQPIKARFLWKSMSDLDRIRSGGSPYGSFGLKEEELSPFVAQLSFKRLIFVREYFFLRIAQFVWAKLFSWKSSRLRYAKPLFMAMKWIDKLFANSAWLRRNQLSLTWGFDK